MDGQRGSRWAAWLWSRWTLVKESVDALSADEALLLARELPHLGKLIAGTLAGVDREVSRRLALGVLIVRFISFSPRRTWAYTRPGNDYPK